MRRAARCLFVLVILTVVPMRHAAAQPADSPVNATVRGLVLDREGGAPIADVLVELQDLKLSAKTDDRGRFEFTNVVPGRRTLYVSLVGFILVKRRIEVAPGGSLDVTIALTEGTGSYSEEITVKADRFPEPEKSVPAQQTLGSADIQNLRNMLTNDPLRAIQVLPSVTTGDDFRAEFAVRGSGFGQMTFTFDGIATTFLLHTVQQIDDGGSVAMVNGDILDGVTLLNGSYPQRYGNRIGAELDFRMREGSRARTETRVGVSGTDASVVAEGPLGGHRRGSWLVSARKSYLELLLKQISEDNDFGFGFSDVQSKLAYDVSRRNRVELTLVAGRSRADQGARIDQVNEVHDGRNAAQLVNAAWRFSPTASLVLTERVALAANQFSNTNILGVDLGRGEGRDVTWRTDVAAQVAPAFAVDAGVQAQRQGREELQREYDPGGAPRQLQTFDADALLTSAYAQTRWTAGPRFAVTAGGRIDRWSLTRDTSGSPWVQIEMPLAGSLKLRAGAAAYRQFPDFTQAIGLRAGANLRAERARHADVGLEQTLFGGTGRWQLTFYNREERDVFRLPGTEFRIVADRLVGPSTTSRWVNALDGYARGMEVLIQRRSTAGVSGWLSYSLGFNRYRDRTTGEAFDGDFDQRHTFNAYAIYRVTSRFSLAAKLRVGSNVPAAGYWEERNGGYFVGPSRNEVRVPAYSRLDLRANRAFNWQNKRLTLFVEALNALGHDNQRVNVSSIDGRTRQVFSLFESMFPLIPSAGILLEF